MSDTKTKFDGYRFECQGSGKCCVARGGYGYVYFSQEDRRRLAKHLGLSTAVFTKQYCTQTNGWYHLKDFKGDCRFLNENRCSVYEARPTQCRTWPFWPENMKAKVWRDEVAAFCPGVGKGPEIPAEDVERQVQAASWTK